MAFNVSLLLTLVLINAQAYGRSLTPVIIRHPLNVTVKLGQKTTLLCAFNVPVICGWMRNGKQMLLGTDGHYNFTMEKNGNHAKNCTIEFEFQAEDAAKWECFNYEEEGLMKTVYSIPAYLEQITQQRDRVSQEDPLQNASQIAPSIITVDTIHHNGYNFKSVVDSLNKVITLLSIIAFLLVIIIVILIPVVILCIRWIHPKKTMQSPEHKSFMNTTDPQ